MGLFDLDDYEHKKKRADKSAVPPRTFPVVHADVHFDGRVQNLRFEPVLIDGYHVFISFRPEDATSTRTLMVGALVEKEKGVYMTEQIMQGLTFYTDDAFEPKNWLNKAKKNVEAGYFGRLRLEREYLSPKSRRFGDELVFQFFSSTGVVDEEDYIVQRDVVSVDHDNGYSRDDDIIPDFAPWAPAADALRLLIDLDEDAFNHYLKTQQADPNGLYGLSVRWKNLSFEERHALLPQFEREIEAEILSLMQAVVWSDPVFTQPNELLSQGTGYWDRKPFWRCPRFWINPKGDKGQQHWLDEHSNERFEERTARIWPYISSHFSGLYQALPSKETVHPLVQSWMSCQGAYIVEFDSPNAHEHLEFRLILRDFLLEKGVNLDDIDAELLAKHKSS